MITPSKFGEKTIVGAVVYKDDEKTEIIPFADASLFLKSVRAWELNQKDDPLSKAVRFDLPPSEVIYGGEAEIEAAMKRLAPCGEDDLSQFHRSDNYDIHNSFVAFRADKCFGEVPLYNGDWANLTRILELAKKYGRIHICKNHQCSWEEGQKVKKRLAKTRKTLSHNGRSFFESDGDWFCVSGDLVEYNPNLMKQIKAKESREKSKVKKGKITSSEMRVTLFSLIRLLAYQIGPVATHTLQFHHYGSALTRSEIIGLSASISKLLAKLGEPTGRDGKRLLDRYKEDIEKSVGYIPGLLASPDKELQEYGKFLEREAKNLVAKEKAAK